MVRVMLPYTHGSESLVGADMGTAIGLDVPSGMVAITRMSLPSRDMCQTMGSPSSSRSSMSWALGVMILQRVIPISGRTTRGFPQ